MQQAHQLSLARQIRCVVLTYATRPAIRWAVVAAAMGSGLFGSAVWIAQANGHSWTEGDPVGSILAVFGAYTALFGASGFVILFLLHARQQLIGWTARVLPNTRTSNLIVAGVALPLFAALATVLTKQNYGHALGLFAVSFGVLILAGYATLRPWLLCVIVMGGWTLFHFVPSLEFNLGLVTSDRQRIDQWVGPPHNVTLWTRDNLKALALVSGEAIPEGALDILARERNNALATKLTMMQHYYDLLQTRRIALLLADIIAFIGLIPLSRPPLRRLTVLDMVRRIAARPAPARPPMDVLQHNPITSRLARSLHRRVATHDWRAAGVAAVAMAILSVWFNLQFRLESGVPMLLLMLAFLPGALVAVGWRERWPTFEFESLYPVSRGELITEMATGLMLDVAEFWIASTIATVGVCAVLRPGVLHDGRFWTALLAGGLMQFLWLGGIFFVGQRRQTLSFIVGLIPVALALFLPLEALWRSGRSIRPTVILTIALAEMLIGAAIFAMTWTVLQRAPRTKTPNGLAASI